MAFIEEEDPLTPTTPTESPLKRWRHSSDSPVTLACTCTKGAYKSLCDLTTAVKEMGNNAKKKKNTKAGSYLEGSAAQLLPQWWWLQDNWWNPTNTDVFQTNMVAKGPGIWSSCWDLSKVKVGIFKLHADVTLANFLASLLIWECTAPGSSGPLFFLNSYWYCLYSIFCTYSQLFIKSNQVNLYFYSIIYT